MEEYKQKLEMVMQTPLSVETPEQLYKELAVIESLAYLTVKQQGILENKLSEKNAELREAKAKLAEYSGTVAEKTAKFEAENSSSIKQVEQLEAEIRYWRNTGKAIENKISLGQSILANITSQVKSGMYYANVK